MSLSRRHLLKLGGAALAGASLAPAVARAQAKQQYYVQMPSGVYIAVWEGALKNYGPNMGYDYGGRLMAAWLER